MQFTMKLRGLWAATLATTLCGGSPAFAADRADVLRQIEQARTVVRLPSAPEVIMAQAAAVAAAKALDMYLKQLPTGQIVNKEIKLDELSAELRRIPANPAALAKLNERLLYSHHSSPAQIALQFALENYLDHLRARAKPALAEEYKIRLGDLAVALRADSEKSSSESQAKLHAAYQRLPYFSGGLPLRLKVRQVISYPNQTLLASDRFLNDEASRQKVGMVTPINQSSSGMTIRGSAETKGLASVVLHPNDAEAEIEVQFRGKTQSQLTGSKGPVNVFERGQAEIDASDVGYLSATAGVRTSSATSKARSDIRPYGVQVNMSCRLLQRLVTKIAWKKAWEQKAAGDRQAEQKIEGQIQTELARITNDKLHEINQLFHSFYPLTGSEYSPAPKLHFSTTSSHLFGGAEFASLWQTAAPSPPPAVSGIDRALLFQVHESALHNNANSLAGRTLNEPDFREIVFDTLALTPDEPHRTRGRVPARVTLTDRDPIDVTLQDGLLAIAFHIDAFQEKGRRYEGKRTVRVNYRPRIAAQGMELVREGAVRVEPASVAGQPDLTKLMSDVLPQRADTQGSTTTGALGASYNLRVSHVSVADGWLNVGWEHDETWAASKQAAQPMVRNISTNGVQP